MRSALLTTLVALLALLVFWLWPEAADRSTRGTNFAGPATQEGTTEALVPAAAPATQPRPGEERASVEVEVETEPGPAEEEATPAPGRLLRVRYLDAKTEQPLVGYSLDLFKRFRREPVPTTGVTGEAGEFLVRTEPGEYLPLQPSVVGDAGRLAREISPEVFELPAGEPDDPYLVTLHGRVPPGVLEVEVVHQDGTSAADAWALFNSLTDVQPFVDVRTRTDARGRAWLGIWDLTGFTDGIVRAWDEQGNVSEFHPIEAPFVPGIRRLVLAPGAQIEVLVRDGEDQPLASQRILLTSKLEAGPRRYEETDAAGRFAYTGVFPGDYDVGARQGVTHRWVYESVSLRHGDEQTVELVLEEVDRFAALRGRVVDEEGAPLSGVTLGVTPDGGWSENVRTDESGEFAYYTAECESLLVQANVWAEGDVYEPASLRVAYGTDDLLLARVRSAKIRSFEVEVVDALTGAEVEHFSATIDRGPGTEEWSSSYAPRRAFQLRVLEDARWRIASHGYLVRELELEKELDRLGEGERLRVELEAGLDHAFFVRDAETLEPIEGVVFRSENQGEVRSDASGLVQMRAPEWSTYQVSKAGYEPEEWDPDDYVLWAFGPLLLVREEDEGAEER